MTDGLFTDTQRWWRSWTWRSLLEAACLRGLEIARRKQTPSGGLLVLRIAKEWEERESDLPAPTSIDWSVKRDERFK